MPIQIVEFGGIAPKITDRRTKPNMAEVAENVDLERNTLKPFRQPLKVSEAVGETLFTSHCCFITGDCNSHYSQYGFGCDEIIVATGSWGYPVYSDSKDCPPNWKRLGFSCDMDKPKATAVDDIEFEEETGKNFGMEMRSYYYTLVNDKGWESQPSYPSDWIRAETGKQVIITGINPPAEDDYTSINIYRAQSPLDYGSEQKDVVQATYLLVGTIGANESSFVDDVIVAGKANITEKYANPPEDLYSVDSWRSGRLIGLSGNTVVMSERGLPYAWNSKYTVALDRSNAKRLVTSEEGLAYVLTDGQPFVLELHGDCDDKSQALTLSSVGEHLPIISQRSAVEWNGGVLYATIAGLCYLRGTEAQVITQDYFTSQQWQEIHAHTMKGAIHEGYYYGTTDTTTIRLRLPDNIYARNSTSTLTTLSVKPLAMHVSNQGRLYMTLDEDGYKGTYEWNQGDGFMPMHWRSTIQVEAGTTRYSAYKLVAEGDGNIIKHSVDTRVIQTHQHYNNQPTRLPVGHRGLSWQVDITGTKEVLEYHLANSIRDLAKS